VRQASGAFPGLKHFFAIFWFIFVISANSNHCRLVTRTSSDNLSSLKHATGGDEVRLSPGPKPSVERGLKPGGDELYVVVALILVRLTIFFVGE
jgi:hypothetical protein